MTGFCNIRDYVHMMSLVWQATVRFECVCVCVSPHNSVALMYSCSVATAQCTLLISVFQGMKVYDKSVGLCRGLARFI